MSLIYQSIIKESYRWKALVYNTRIDKTYYITSLIKYPEPDGSKHALSLLLKSASCLNESCINQIIPYINDIPQSSLPICDTNTTIAQYLNITPANDCDLTNLYYNGQDLVLSLSNPNPFTVKTEVILRYPDYIGCPEQFYKNKTYLIQCQPNNSTAIIPMQGIPKFENMQYCIHYSTCWRC